MSATPPVDVWVFRSPRKGKKFRMVMPSRGVTIDFGQSGASDFTRHKDAARMLRYLRRHAADVGPQLSARSKDARLDPNNKAEFDQRLYEETIERALGVGASRREDWEDSRTRGFWSRWLLCPPGARPSACSRSVSICASTSRARQPQTPNPCRFVLGPSRELTLLADMKAGYVDFVDSFPHVALQ